MRAVVKELGYVYNQPLGGGRKRVEKTPLFAIILPTLANPYFAELLDIVEQEAQHLGRALLVFNSRGDVQRELTLMNACQQYNIDGLFIVPCSRTTEHIATLNRLPFPVVVLTQLVAELTSVAVDHVEGGAQVAEHLVSMGHTAIGYLGSVDDVEQKFGGFRDRLAALGVPIEPENIIQTPALTAIELAECFNDYLDTHPSLPFSGICSFTFFKITIAPCLEPSKIYNKAKQLSKLSSIGILNSNIEGILFKYFNSSKASDALETKSILYFSCNNNL